MVYRLASTSLCLRFFFIYLISNLISLWLEKMLDMISVFLNLPKLALWPRMWSILENVSCALENNVYSAAICLGVDLFGLILCMTLFGSWTWISVFFPRLGKFSAIMSAIMSSLSFSLSLSLSPHSFWDPCNANVSMLYVVPEVS